MTMTYNSLVNQLLDYLNRTDADTTAEVPNFIYQAEQRICRESKNIGLEVYVTGTFTVNVNVMAKPGRWRRNITFNFGNGIGNNTANQIVLRSYEFVRNYWPDATQLGPPKFYCDYGYDHFLMAPTPDQNYPFELGYLELPEPLSVNVQTNFLTNNAPDVLLYASLLEATPFLKNTDLIPTWERMYERGLASLNSQDDQRVVDRATNRGAD
jgi:hypothetical protein